MAAVPAGWPAGLGRGPLEGPGPLHDVPRLAAGSAHPVATASSLHLRLALLQPFVRLVHLLLGHERGRGLLESILESFDLSVLLMCLGPGCWPHHPPAAV